jgi:hypothetical protein
MPFVCQLTLPPYGGSPIEAKLESWTSQPLALLETGDTVAHILIAGHRHLLCVAFPCGLSALIAKVGDTLKTGDRVAACIAEGEEIAYGQDYLFIRAAHTPLP